MHPHRHADTPPGPRGPRGPWRVNLDPALFLPCAGGVEALLADEVARIVADPGLAHGLRLPPDAVQPQRGGVAIDWPGMPGDDALRLAMLLNLESRLAQRVLLRLADAPYETEDDLYAMARAPDWLPWLTPDDTLRVDVTAVRSPLRSLHFATLRIKDAVCDALRDATGARPSVDTHRPDLPLLLHLEADTATLYADSSGEALFKRGWREDKGEAPLKETLAAAMLAAAGWQGRAEDGALFDPCCGSGTIVIEAAQIACGIAPGLRRRFAFERWPLMQPLLPWWRERQEAARRRVHAPAVAIHGGDVSFRMIDFARRNAQRAGVEHAVDLKTADLLQRQPPADHGVLILNPPYGERITPKGTESSRDEVPADFFQRLARHWKQQYAGWTAWMLSPDMKLPTAMRLKEARRLPMWNGPIECRLYRFDLVAGSMRTAGNGPDGPASPASPAATAGEAGPPSPSD